MTVKLLTGQHLELLSLTGNCTGSSESTLATLLEITSPLIVLFVCFVALRRKSTAMVIAGRSVHLTTLFPGQA